MTEWRNVAVEALCSRVTSGGTPSRKRTDFYAEEGIPWVKSQELIGARIAVTEEHISEAGLKGSSAKLLPPDTVLLAMYGANVGQLGWLGVEATVNQAICAMVCDPEVTDSRFLYYALAGARATLIGKAHGAAQQNLSQQLIKPFELAVPDLATQQRVGDILRSIDDLIENNRRRGEVLEEMARAIYREWFVKFRYPGHGDVPMVDSAQGPIPEGWRLGTLGDLAVEIRDSVRPSEATQSIPYVPIDEIDPRSLTLHRSRPGKDAASSLRLFRAGDVLFGAMRAYFHKVCLAPFDGVTRSTCFVLRGHAEWRSLPAFYLDDDETVAYASNHSSGSTIPYAKWDGVLSQRQVALPPQKVADAFSDAADPMLAKARALADEVAILESLRDLLLPKLVTGQIDVSNLDLDALISEKVA